MFAQRRSGCSSPRQEACLRITGSPYGVALRGRFTGSRFRLTTGFPLGYTRRTFRPTDLQGLRCPPMNALMVYPEFPPTYWSYTYSLRFVGKKCLLPPLGLVTVAALLPDHWRPKVVDLNIESLSD